MDEIKEGRNDKLDFLPVFTDTYFGPGKYQNLEKYIKHELKTIN